MKYKLYLSLLIGCIVSILFSITHAQIIPSSSSSVLLGNGVNTAPKTVADGRAIAQVAANASIATYTPSADGSFEVTANLLVTTATSHSFTINCTYTDESNTTRTIIMNLMLLNNNSLTATVVNTNGTVPYSSVPYPIRVKGGTAITILTPAGGTYTTVVYNVEGIIKQIGS